MAMTPPFLRRWTLAVVSLLVCLEVATLAASQAASREPARKPYRPKLEVRGESVRHPIWGVEIRIPGYKDWKDNPHRNRPNLVLAANSRGSCSLSLTIWVEKIRAGATAEECRRGYAGNPEALSKQDSVRLHENQVAPITYTLFDYVLGEQAAGTMLNNQLYGYWVRDDHCFELHASSLACDGFARVAMPILQSVEISEDTGATLETVTIAMRDGGDPRDWQLHGAVGGIYLHKAEPAEPELARRFYLSALKLGGSLIGPKDLWLLEEGVGLSWLMQDEGVPGIPHLARALEMAKSTPELGEVISESTYNLVCALTIAGEIEAACDRCRELLGPLDTVRRESMIKEIDADKQLDNLRKSACYTSILDDLDQRQP